MYFKLILSNDFYDEKIYQKSFDSLLKVKKYVVCQFSCQALTACDMHQMNAKHINEACEMKCGNFFYRQRKTLKRSPLKVKHSLNV